MRTLLMTEREEIKAMLEKARLLIDDLWNDMAESELIDEDREQSDCNVVKHGYLLNEINAN